MKVTIDHTGNIVNEACGQCRFWQDMNTNGGVGMCKRHAPIASLDKHDHIRSLWPTTYNGDRCGDWELYEKVPVQRDLVDEVHRACSDALGRRAKGDT